MIAESLILGDGASVPDQGVPGHVLVVDDSAAQRRILTTFLTRWGYQVSEAESGHEALEICRGKSIDLVISDWMMPGMDGLELCRAFRALPEKPYGYFILLTSKNEKIDVARGLDVGADDFVSKPVSSHELMARIRAGERILGMERALRQSNRQVSEAFEEISALYDALDRDLIEARSLQQSLVRENHRDFGAGQVSLLLKPSGHVGGDLVGFFPVNDDQIGLFSLDVSGHGVASALLTVRLAAHFSANAGQNVALETGTDGRVHMRSPAAAAASLNTIFLRDIKSDQYFTMSLACVTLSTGRVQMVQCGHPNPFVLAKSGAVNFAGTPGFPVGLMPDASWEDREFFLSPGDKLVIVSDGATECTNPTGDALDDQGFADIASANRSARGSAFLDAALWDLSTFAGDQEFDDDVSALLFEYDGPGATKPRRDKGEADLF